MTDPKFSLNHHEEQKLITGANSTALATTRNRLYKTVNFRLKEFHDINYSAEKPWNKTCVDLLVKEYERENGTAPSKGYVSRLKQEFKHDYDLTTCIRALTVKNEKGNPIFGDTVSEKARALIKHRNFSAHFSPDFTRQSSYEFMTMLIELFDCMGYLSECDEIFKLRDSLDIEGYYAFLEAHHVDVPVRLDESGSNQSEEQNDAPKDSTAISSVQKKKLSPYQQLQEMLNQNDPDAVHFAIKNSLHMVNENKSRQALTLLGQAQKMLDTSSPEELAEFYEARGRIFRALGEAKPALKNFKLASAVDGIDESRKERLDNRIKSYQNELSLT